MKIRTTWLVLAGPITCCTPLMPAGAKCLPLENPGFYRDGVLNSPPSAGSYNVFVKATPDCPVDHYVRCWTDDRAAFIGAKGASQPPECKQPH